jgi:metallophosphoesterase (TIGR00282 family)
MKILAIGDIVANNGVSYALKMLSELKKEYGIDFVIANAENACIGNGLNTSVANELIKGGVDVITLGNHAFKKNEIVNVLLNKNNVIRPANFPEGTLGKGCTIVTKNGVRICVINLLGRMNLLSVDCPFKKADKILNGVKNKCDIIIVDFHADATSEKLAMGYYLDSKVNAVFGTHTHVQTADERILPGGTGYISDIGMTGTLESVLGVKKEIIIQKFITQLPKKFEVAEGKQQLCGVVFEFDDITFKCKNVTRVKK